MKPKIKKEVAVSWVYKPVGIIYLYATNDAANELSEFGDLFQRDSGEWRMIVDPRFDFDEVLAYIERYGEDKK